MARVVYVHWKAGEAEAGAQRLRAAGHRVVVAPADGAAALRLLRSDPPEVVVIDLARLPSHGRELALALRRARPLRGVPIVVVEGDPEKTDRICRDVPSVVRATWRGIRGAIRRAIAAPPDPDAPPPVPAASGYSGTPLPKKLGIKAGARVLLVAAPPDVEAIIVPLPAGASLRRGRGGPNDLLLWFVTQRATLDARIDALGTAAGSGGLWICWPKKTSGVASDLAQEIVRAAGLGAGLVDFKICAIDATWSGLRFVRRR